MTVESNNELGLYLLHDMLDAHAPIFLPTSENLSHCKCGAILYAPHFGYAHPNPSGRILEWSICKIRKETGLTNEQIYLAKEISREYWSHQPIKWNDTSDPGPR